jgi:hypothetical protein
MTPPDPVVPDPVVPDPVVPDPVVPDPAVPDPAVPDPVVPPDIQPDDKPTGAPEKYEEFTLPEGVEMDADRLTGFQTLAKESNLTQASAQKYVDMASELTANTVEAVAVEKQKAWDDYRATQVADLKKELGSGFDPFVEQALKGVKRFGGEALVSYLDKSGLGDLSIILKAFEAADKAAGEAKVIDGDDTKPDTRPLAKRVYPNLA